MPIMPFIPPKIIIPGIKIIIPMISPINTILLCSFPRNLDMYIEEIVDGIIPRLIIGIIFNESSYSGKNSAIKNGIKKIRSL